MRGQDFLMNSLGTSEAQDRWSATTFTLATDLLARRVSADDEQNMQSHDRSIIDIWPFQPI